MSTTVEDVAQETAQEMAEHTAPSGERDRRGWGPGQGPGRFGLFWIGVWTFFLLEPLGAAWDRRDTVAGWVGIATTLAFAAWYISVFGYQRSRGFARRSFHMPVPQALGAIAVALLLAVIDCAAIGQEASATAVYVSVLCAMTLPGPLAALTVLNAGGWYAASYLLPGWTVNNGLLLSTLTASVAVWGVQQMILGNIALRRANEENQTLAVSEERNRFARDLHDILGHSLTVITVKAELANRLMDVDVDRAKVEVKELERLSRDALADVRRAVEGYRELTLPGEITRARSALRTAEIEDDLPTTTDAVSGDLRELFAWTVREGVTNVIRHSGATRCTVRLTPTSAEVVDDGRGCEGRIGGGSGLIGLRERASALGATVITRSLDPQGFSLQVTVPA